MGQLEISSWERQQPMQIFSVSRVQTPMQVFGTVGFGRLDPLLIMVFTDK